MSWLNDLRAYCGGLRVKELKKGHIQTRIELHSIWRSVDTHRSVISIVKATFNRATEMYDISNPLKGLKKPTGKPRLQSISPEDEKTLYVINLNNNGALVEIDIATKTVTKTTAISNPSNGNPNDVRPWGLSVHKGAVFSEMIGLTDEQF